MASTLAPIPDTRIKRIGFHALPVLLKVKGLATIGSRTDATHFAPTTTTHHPRIPSRQASTAMDNATRPTGRWDPSVLAGTCGLSESNWSTILHLISGDSTVLQQAIEIAKATGASDAVWLDFLEERVKSAILSFPDGEPFYWTTESLRLVNAGHRGWLRGS